MGGRVPDGWGNTSCVGLKQARKDVREFLEWYVERTFGLSLDGNMELLYDIGQRGIARWYGGIRGTNFNGSPKAMVELAYPKGPDGLSEWDPTRFGQRKERQAAFYHRLRSWLNDDELKLMNLQPGMGYDHKMGEFGIYPLTHIEGDYYCGGTKNERQAVGLSGA